ncbi:MAG TPA: CHAT domain-containing protein [Azospirillaceae bacterium]|nr:CHAT domain-containing protein [Azospirillaceae bacterium]
MTIPDPDRWKHRVRTLLLAAALAGAAAAPARAEMPEVTALVRQAESLQAAGFVFQAEARLAEAVRLAEAGRDGQAEALASGALGNLRLVQGRLEEAQSLLERCRSLAETAGDARTAATGSTNLDIVRALRGDPAALPQSPAAAGPGGVAASGTDGVAASVPGGVAASVNAARIALSRGDPAAARGHLDRAAAVLDRAGAPTPQRLAYAAASLRWMEAGGADPGGAEAARLYRYLSDVAGAAEPRPAMEAYGLLGALYRRSGRTAEALQLSREALSLAQGIDESAGVLRWALQIGRLLREGGDAEGAIAAYRQAAEAAERRRPDLVRAGGGPGVSYREAVGPVFTELADLLLRRAARDPGGAAGQADLQAARQAVEQLKAVELEDYFQDSCVAALQSRTAGVDRLAPGTAALYPILLEDRTELVVSVGDRLHQVVVPVGAAALTAEVRRMRLGLERLTTHQYLTPARRLYDWLLRPVEPLLAANGVTTLVVVPDGPLRTVPLSALHDGEHFVAERYAVAVTPGLTLFDPRPIRRDRVRVLVSALTEAVQGYPALPAVGEEVAAIQSLFESETLKDGDFLLSAVNEELEERPYSIVHMASHGEFGGTAASSFVLTFDDRMDLNRLESFMGLGRDRTSPVELLTLSACRTAAGDDRAALGLAGIAIKAGARSALASLWFINDQASAELVSEFYRHLADPALSKAEALRRAQAALIARPGRRHPGYWAPLILIGNWL